MINKKHHQSAGQAVSSQREVKEDQLLRLSEPQLFLVFIDFFLSMNTLNLMALQFRSILFFFFFFFFFFFPVYLSHLQLLLNSQHINVGSELN